MCTHYPPTACGEGTGREMTLDNRALGQCVAGWYTAPGFIIILIKESFDNFFSMLLFNIRDLQQMK